MNAYATGRQGLVLILLITALTLQACQPIQAPIGLGAAPEQGSVALVVSLDNTSANANLSSYAESFEWYLAPEMVRALGPNRAHIAATIVSDARTALPSYAESFEWYLAPEMIRAQGPNLRLDGPQDAMCQGTCAP